MKTTVKQLIEKYKKRLKTAEIFKDKSSEEGKIIFKAEIYFTKKFIKDLYDI